MQCSQSSPNNVHHSQSPPNNVRYYKSPSSVAEYSRSPIKNVRYSQTPPYVEVQSQLSLNNQDYSNSPVRNCEQARSPPNNESYSSSSPNSAGCSKSPSSSAGYSRSPPNSTRRASATLNNTNNSRSRSAITNGYQSNIVNAESPCLSSIYASSNSSFLTNDISTNVDQKLNNSKQHEYENVMQHKVSNKQNISLHSNILKKNIIGNFKSKTKVDDILMLDGGGHYSFDEDSLTCSDVQCNGNCINNIHNFTQQRSNSLTVNYSSDCSIADLDDSTDVVPLRDLKSPLSKQTKNDHTISERKTKLRSHKSQEETISHINLIENSRIPGDKHLKDQINGKYQSSKKSTNDIRFTSSSSSSSIHFGASTFYVKGTASREDKIDTSHFATLDIGSDFDHTKQTVLENIDSSAKQSRKGKHKKSAKLRDLIPRKFIVGCNSPDSSILSSGDSDSLVPRSLSTDLPRSETNVTETSKKSSNSYSTGRTESVSISDSEISNLNHNVKPTPNKARKLLSNVINRLNGTGKHILLSPSSKNSLDKDKAISVKSNGGNENISTKVSNLESSLNSKYGSSTLPSQSKRSSNYSKRKNPRLSSRTYSVSSRKFTPSIDSNNWKNLVANLYKRTSGLQDTDDRNDLTYVSYNNLDDCISFDEQNVEHEEHKPQIPTAINTEDNRPGKRSKYRYNNGVRKVKRDFRKRK